MNEGRAIFSQLVSFLPDREIEAGAFYVMDRGYIDFERLYRFSLSSAFFVVRAESNVLLQRRYSHPVDKSTGARSDQTVLFSSFQSASAYPDPLRKISYYDADTNQHLVFLTNATGISQRSFIVFISSSDFRTHTFA